MQVKFSDDSWAAIPSQTVKCFSFVCSVPLQQRNSKRFERDPLSEKAESLTTFDMMLSVLRRHQPQHVLLENVKGAQPRAYLAILVLIMLMLTSDFELIF